MKSLWVLIVLAVLVIPGYLRAEVLPEKHTPYKKLGRGIGDVVSAPGEYVGVFSDEQDRTGNTLVAFFVTLTHGSAEVFKRAASGFKDAKEYKKPNKNGYASSMKTFNIEKMTQDLLKTKSRVDDLAGS